MPAEPHLEYTVPEGVLRERADKLLAARFKEWSRGRIQEAFDAGEVFLNGTPIKKNHRISSGDCITLTPPRLPPTTVEATDIPLSVLYEDEYLVVINKEAGMVTHPGSNTGDDTLVHALLHHTGGKLSRAGGALRPGVVHRLDKDTSGCILFAKTDEVYLQLVQLFSQRDLVKEYLALVMGVPRLLSGTIKDPIDRHPVNRTRMQVSPTGRPARTDWVLEERFGQRFSLLRCRIHTGRTHQIRVHLASMGHPIWGDKAYGYRRRHDETDPPSQVLLHAERLAFRHPVTGEQLDLRAPFSPEFRFRLESLRQHSGSDAVAQVVQGVSKTAGVRQLGQSDQGKQRGR